MSVVRDLADLRGDAPVVAREQRVAQPAAEALEAEAARIAVGRVLDLDADPMATVPSRAWRSISPTS
jgi:hypothetical protein